MAQPPGIPPTLPLLTIAPQYLQPGQIVQQAAQPLPIPAAQYILQVAPQPQLIPQPPALPTAPLQPQQQQGEIGGTSTLRSIRARLSGYYDAGEVQIINALVKAYREIFGEEPPLYLLIGDNSTPIHLPAQLGDPSRYGNALEFRLEPTPVNNDGALTRLIEIICTFQKSITQTQDTIPENPFSLFCESLKRKIQLVSTNKDMSSAIRDLDRLYRYILAAKQIYMKTEFLNDVAPACFEILKKFRQVGQAAEKAQRQEPIETKLVEAKTLILHVINEIERYDRALIKHKSFTTSQLEVMITMNDQEMKLGDVLVEVRRIVENLEMNSLSLLYQTVEFLSALLDQFQRFHDSVLEGKKYGIILKKDKTDAEKEFLTDPLFDSCYVEIVSKLRPKLLEQLQSILTAYQERKFAPAPFIFSDQTPSFPLLPPVTRKRPPPERDLPPSKRPRVIEDIPSASRQLEEIASREGMQCVDVGADGNCFYYAMAHQLALHGFPGYTNESLRSLAAQTLTSQKEVYREVIAERLAPTETYDDYIYKVRNSNMWVDAPEIQALANFFNVNFTILQSDGLRSMNIEPAGGRSPKTLHLGYIIGLHYVSLVRKSSE